MKRKAGGLSQIIRLLVILCIAGFVLILYATTVASAFRSNIAWIDLNAIQRDETILVEGGAQSLKLFARAVEVDNLNESAWFGLGNSYALQGQTNLAIDAWSEAGTTPATLIAYGMHDRNRGNLDTALTLFRAAEARGDSDNLHGRFLAATICQRTIARQDILNEANIQYCADYLVNSGNNLIVNGDFSQHELYGWDGEHFFTGANAARLEIGDLDESGDPVMKLVGTGEGNHKGLYQQISLIPGTEVRFSGRFRLSGEDNLTARILYIGWQSEDGEAQGNHGEKRSGQMNWTKFERTFQVPEYIKQGINFYPVNFSGEGTVWFDDIQLEIIHD